MSSNERTLLPCPFCAGGVEIAHYHPDMGPSSCFVKCWCGARGTEHQYHHGDHVEAIAKARASWNRRTAHERCVTHAAEHRMRHELPCPWCVIDELKRNRDRLAAEASPELRADLVAALAHRGCCGTEHDAANGKLHGCCVVCGVPWPCDTAKYFLRSVPVDGADSADLPAVVPDEILGKAHLP